MFLFVKRSQHFILLFTPQQSKPKGEVLRMDTGGWREGIVLTVKTEDRPGKTRRLLYKHLREEEDSFCSTYGAQDSARLSGAHLSSRLD